MSIEESWGNFFKAEIKASGFKLFAQEKISISSGTDTGIQAYVRVSPPFKVQLSSKDIASESFTADCTCPMAKKSQFCKHIWATLLGVEQKYPDFLSSKRVIDKPSAESDAPTEGKESYQATAKVRASEYRKEQYQKQKERVKAIKRERQGRDASVSARAFPAEVADALAYFSKNGFPMDVGPDEAIVAEAKKKLSRVFHPDKGGSNEEIVELNSNCEILLRFLR